MNEKQQKDLDDLHEKYANYIVTYGLNEDISQFLNGPSPAQKSCIRMYMDKDDLHQEMMDVARSIKVWMGY